MTRFTLQISDQLNTWLTEQAALNHRSKNKQIEHLLDMAMRVKSVNVTAKLINPQIEQLLKAHREAE